MDTVKAKEVQICIFTPKYFGSVSEYPADERRIFEAFGNVITELRQKHGQNVPVYLEFCPLTESVNQGIVAYWGFSQLPAVQIIAEYPDGTMAQYGLAQDVGDKFTGVNWTADDIRPYTEAVLYNRKPAETSIVCQIFPPLCNVGAYLWLAAAGYSTLEAFQRRGGAQAAWGVAAALSWDAFFKGDGLKKLGLGK